MLEHVLAVRRAVVKTTENGQQLGIEPGDICLERSLFARLADLLFDLFLGGVVRLLDASRVDPPVSEQILERDARNFAAHSIERRKHDCAGSVVDDHIDSSGGFEGANVASLATNDSTLEIIRRQLHRRDRGRGRVAGCRSLNARGDDRAGAPIAVLLGLFLDPANELRCVMTRTLLHAAEQLHTGLIGGHASDALELAVGTALRLPHSGFGIGQGERLLCCRLFAFERDQLALGGEVLSCSDALLEARDLCASLVEALLEFAPQLKQVLLAVNGCLFANCVGFAVGGCDGTFRIGT